MNTKHFCIAVGLGWAWPAALVWVLSRDPKALLLLIAAPAMGWLTWRMSGTQMRRHGGWQVWPPLGALAVVVACLLLAGCSPTGAKPAYAPGSARNGETTQPMTLPTDEPIATATPIVAMSVAQSVQRTETANQVEPGLGLLLATLAVVIGIPAFWVISLGAHRRAKGTV